MKNLKKPNPIILALAIVGLGALLYGAWTMYHQHVVAEQERAIIAAPPSTPLSGLFKPSKKPPPQ
jgi:uncharacterized membrane protein YpjA